MSTGGVAVARMLAEAEPDADDISDDDADSAGDGDDQDDEPSMYQQLLAQGLAQKKVEAQAKRAAEKAASTTAFGCDTAEASSSSAAAQGTGMKKKKQGAKSGGFRSGFLFRDSGKKKPAAAAAKATPLSATAAKPGVPAAAVGSNASSKVLELDDSGGFDLARAVSVSGSTTAPKSSSKAPVLPGVREAVAADGATAAKLQHRLSSDRSWLSEGLMRRIASDPALAAGFAHPRCQAAIADLQRDPVAAKKKYASDPLVNDFLGRFMGVMGDHFTRIGAKEEEAAAAAVKPAPKFDTKAAPKSSMAAGAAAAREIGAEELSRMARDSECSMDRAIGVVLPVPASVP
jgi:hypothetical protein